jgi:hypothetical protein
LLKPYFPNHFSYASLNDVICIAFWVPIMLFIVRKLRLRKDDAPPRGSEILIPLIVWSWFFEAVLPFVPFFKHLATSDYHDILSYTEGALLAAIFWKIWYRQKFWSDRGNSNPMNSSTPSGGIFRSYGA